MRSRPRESERQGGGTPQGNSGGGRSSRARGRNRRSRGGDARSGTEPSTSDTAERGAKSSGQGGQGAGHGGSAGGGKGGRRRPGQNNRRGRNRRQAQPDPVSFWGDASELPPPRTDVRITDDPDAVPRSLGTPPLPGQEAIAGHYFAAVYDRAVATAGALAAAGGLIDPEELIDDGG